MRTKLAVAGLLVGVAGALLPAAPASAQCIQVEGVDRCIWICPKPLGPCTT
jgi:hypothetical protein